MVDFKILQWNPDLTVLLVGVKDSGILSALAADSGPEDVFGVVDQLLPYRVGMAGIAVHFQNLLVGDQSHCEIIKSGHLTADDQRRAEDAPQRHHCDLFILRKLGAKSRVIDRKSVV